MTGRIFGAAEAKALKLVTHVSEDPIAHARALAEEIATRSPDATAAAKFLLQEAWQGDEAHALRAERSWQRRLLGLKNQRISIARNNPKSQPQPFAKRSIGDL